MRSAFAALVVCCALSACGADPQPTVPGDAPEAEFWQDQRIPEWTAALDGSDRAETGQYFSSPAAADAAGQVVLWRGFAPGRCRLIALRLSDEAALGTVHYFEKLRQENALSPADILMIAIALQRASAIGTPVVHDPAPLFLRDLKVQEELPVLHDPPPLATRPPLSEEPEPDPQEPVPPVSRIPPLLSPLQPPPAPPKFSPPTPYNPHPWCPWGPPTFTPGPAPTPDLPTDIPPPPPGPSASDVARAIANALHASPWDKGYQPARGEKRAIFVSNGLLYVGYMKACPDYQPHPALARWEMKTGTYLRVMRFSGEQAWKMSPWVLHNLWNDGKNPECMANARRVGETACFSGYAVPFAACALVPGCWATFVAAAATPAGALGGVGLGFGVNECISSVQDYAAQNICTR